jgi:hypothetical protein
VLKGNQGLRLRQSTILHSIQISSFSFAGSKYQVYIAERDRKDERAGNEINCLEEDEEKTDTNKDGKL